MEHESLYTFGSVSEDVHNDCGFIHYTMPYGTYVHACILAPFHMIVFMRAVAGFKKFAKKEHLLEHRHTRAPSKSNV